MNIHVQPPAVEHRQRQRLSETCQTMVAAATLGGRFVRSFIESSNPCYLTDGQKLGGQGYVDPPSLCLKPVELTKRVIECCSPKYYLLTRCIPGAAVTELLTRLSKVAVRIMPAAMITELLVRLPLAVGGVIEVSSADTLSRIGLDSSLPLNAHYLQTADIDARDGGVASIGPSYLRSFTGSYDGGGYTIYGLQHCMFGYLIESGEVHSLKFSNASIVIDDDDGYPTCLAVAACHMNEASMRDVVIEQSTFVNHQQSGNIFISRLGFACGCAVQSNLANIFVYNCSMPAPAPAPASAGLGCVAGHIFYTTIECSRVECCSISQKDCLSAALVTGDINRYSASTNTKVLNTKVLNSRISNCTNVGIEYPPVGGKSPKDLPRISGSTACNVILNGQVVNDDHCPENNGTTSPCTALKPAEFLESCPTEAPITDPLPESSAAITDSLPESSTAIIDSLPVTSPVPAPAMMQAGIISAAVVVGGTAAYVLGTWAWSRFYKGQRGREFWMSPWTNVQKAVTNISSRGNTRAGSHSDVTSDNPAGTVGEYIPVSSPPDALEMRPPVMQT